MGLEGEVGRSIAYVEDDPEEAILFAEVFRWRGHKVTTFDHPLDLLERFPTLLGEGIDLVVSDCILPDMDGFTLAKELRDRFPDWENPFVILTNLDRYDIREVRERAGVNGEVDKVLSKLGGFDEVLASVSAIVREPRLLSL